MNFREVTTHTALYVAAALLKEANPSLQKGDICKLLGVKTKEDIHSVALGILKVNHVYDMSKGYKLN